MIRRLPDRPRTRVEEIMRARGLTQTNLVEQSGWSMTTIHKITLGRQGLTDQSSRTLARLLECPRASLYQEMGEPIPPRRQRRRLRNGAPEGFTERLTAILALLDADLPALLAFLVAGDYSRLPHETARRLRERVEAQARR